MKYIITLTFFLSTQLLFSQMENGSYKFSNNNITLEFTIEDDGWVISSAKVSNNQSKISFVGKGEYRSKDDYEWYEFQTNECNYSFSLPTNKLTLEIFDCKNGSKSTEVILERK